MPYNKIGPLRVRPGAYFFFCSMEEVMRKLIIAGLVSLLITLTGMYINYRSYIDTDYLKLSLKMHGGEITVENGFGLIVSHIYPMTENASASHNLRISVPGFLLTFLVIAVLITLILTIWQKLRRES